MNYTPMESAHVSNAAATRARLIAKQSLAIAGEVPVAAKKQKAPKPILALTQGIHFKAATMQANLRNDILNPRETRARDEIKQYGFDHVETTTVVGADGTKTKVQHNVAAIELVEMSQHTQQTYADALALYEAPMFRAYERILLSTLTEQEQTVYGVKRASSADFRAFLAAEYPQFRSGLDEYLYGSPAQFDASGSVIVEAQKGVDGCALGTAYYIRDEGQNYKVHNPCTRANSIIGKQLLRFSQGTDTHIAAFVDQVLEVFIAKALDNCISVNQKMLGIAHVFTESDPEEKNAPVLPPSTLLKFINTLDTYTLAKEWTKRSSKSAFVKYVADNSDIAYTQKYVTSYHHAIVRICYSVRMLRAQQEGVSSKEVAICGSIKVADDFKALGSLITLETLNRLGVCFSEQVKFAGTSTISHTMVKHVIRQFCTLYGINFDELWRVILVRLARHEIYEDEAKRKRAAKKVEVSQ